jgi:mannose-6-phosphate isomerase-like protein (cupin superfamily)
MTQPAALRRYEVVDLAELPGVECPCGIARRGLVDAHDVPLTIHQTEISTDARTHYHRQLTETYYILECGADAQMELDGERIPLAPGRLVLIRPGVRHRAIGRMKVLVIVHPKFDPADEWFD